MEWVPKLRSEIEILPIDTSSASQKYVAKIQGERQFEISKTLYQFIRLVDGKRTVGEIAAEFSEENGKECLASDAERIIESYLVPYGIILSENGTPVIPKRKSYLYVRIPLLSQEILRPLTSVLQTLFAPSFFYSALAIIALFHLYFYMFVDKPAILFSAITGRDVVMVYGLIFLTTMFHELGHSSACHHYGAKHGAIGVGLYLYFPVFYADVSDVWKLKRYERAVVDFGGMYFQLLCVPVFYLLYVLSGRLVFLYTIYALNFAVVGSLNPLLRFDGYWLASDIAGVPNLRKRSQETLHYLIRKLLKRGTAAPSPALQIRPQAKYFLYGYTLVSNLFFAFFFYHIIIYLPELLRTYPSALVDFLASVADGIMAMNFSGVFHHLSSIFFPSIMIAMFGMMSYRGISSIIRHFRNRFMPLKSSNRKERVDVIL